MVFPGHTLLHFGHFFVYYNQKKSVLLCKLLNCFVGQCTQTVNYLTTIIAIAGLF